MFSKGRSWLPKLINFRSTKANKSGLATAASQTSTPVTTTVDKSEIDHFLQSADQWWDENKGPTKPLHSLNSLRIPLIRNGLINMKKLPPTHELNSKYLKGLKFLDVGCGGGILSMPLSQLGGDVTGLDASPELILCAKKYSSFNIPAESSLNYVCSKIEEFAPSHLEKFDVVILSEVIEHVTAKDIFLKACISTLKPGGSLFVTTLSQTNTAWLAGIVFGEYILGLLPVGTHHYEKFITAEDLSKLLTKNGCNSVLINGMVYYPYINKWKWTSNTWVNYALHAVKK